MKDYARGGHTRGWKGCRCKNCGENLWRQEAVWAKHGAWAYENWVFCDTDCFEEKRDEHLEELESQGYDVPEEWWEDIDF